MLRNLEDFKVRLDRVEIAWQMKSIAEKKSWEDQGTAVCQKLQE
jgi:hypothetical protein